MFKFGKKKENIEPPEIRGIIKLTDNAKSSGISDDENKIIELTINGKVKRIKYSEADVEMLREQGIPILPEDYSDEYNFIDAVNFGQIESWRHSKS